MDDMPVPMSGADAEAVAAVEQHHAMLAGSLAALVERLVTAGSSWQSVRDELVAWCREELVPHAQAEEKTLYPAAAGIEPARLLVEAMVAEHAVIVRLVEDLAEDRDAIRAAGTATALQTLFRTHLTKENDQVLPLLARTPGADLAGLLAGMHELLGPEDHDE